MKFDQLIDNLQKTYKVDVISAACPHEIIDIKLLDPNDKQTRSSILYFGYDSQKPEKMPVNCILASGKETRPASTEHNLAIIHPEAFSSVFNVCSDLIKNTQRNDFYQYYLEVAEQVQNVDALIDLASQSFGASLILCDRDFRILSCSTQIPVTDELWKHNIKQGYCDYEFISQVRELKAVQMMHAGTNPVEVTCKSSPFRKFASRIYCSDTWIGFVLLIEGDTSYRASHPEMLQLLASVLGDAIMHYAPNLLYQTNEYHSFLYNLLIGAPPETLPDLYLKLSFPERMQVAYVKEKDGTKSPDEAKVIKKCREILPDCHAIVHKDGAVIIGNAENLTNSRKLLSVFGKADNINLGISRPFTDVKTVKNAMEEAVEAYETGCVIAPQESTYHFDQYGIYAMFRKLAAYDDTERYLHPAVRSLLTPECGDGEVLLETLRVYLQSNCNIKESAESLHMHRNSVTYRLHKIEEMCGIDLNDMETCFRLRISFMLLRIHSVKDNDLRQPRARQYN
ncbi:MAG: helix-turn-helix domain-containing protein [Eubacterium sp.]|nr:helix-turn-helix domain-containing protein [Eubacterium sp.]